MSFNNIFKPVPYKKADFVLLGAPYDAGSSYRPGARLAPERIRALAESFNSCSERGIDLSPLRAYDAGDLALSNRAKPAFKTIETSVRKILDDSAVPIILGGDHSITIPSFQAALAHYPTLQLLYLDAHPDLYLTFQGDELSHACVVARVLEFKNMKGDRITQVGIRATTSQQAALAQKANICTVNAWDVDSFEYLVSGPVYLSLDIDVLDLAHAPGCGNPVPGGLTTRQLFSFIQKLKVKIVAMDLVEMNPLLDPADITSLCGARLITETLGVMARNRKV